MQATYVMVAKQEALEFLPAGADLNALTYDQLIAWGQAMKEATGQARMETSARGAGSSGRVRGVFYPNASQGQPACPLNAGARAKVPIAAALTRRSRRCGARTEGRIFSLVREIRNFTLLDVN